MSRGAGAAGFVAASICYVYRSVGLGSAAHKQPCAYCQEPLGGLKARLGAYEAHGAGKAALAAFGRLPAHVQATLIAEAATPHGGALTSIAQASDTPGSGEVAHPDGGASSPQEVPG